MAPCPRCVPHPRGARSTGRHAGTGWTGGLSALAGGDGRPWWPEVSCAGGLAVCPSPGMTGPVTVSQAAASRYIRRPVALPWLPRPPTVNPSLSPHKPPIDAGLMLDNRHRRLPSIRPASGSDDCALTAVSHLTTTVCEPECAS